VVVSCLVDAVSVGKILAPVDAAGFFCSSFWIPNVEKSGVDVAMACCFPFSFLLILSQSCGFFLFLWSLSPGYQCCVLCFLCFLGLWRGEMLGLLLLLLLQGVRAAIVSKKSLHVR
jgi:hypothetical protein